VMVVAVRVDHRRSGIGTVLLESVLAEMQRQGVLTASWLCRRRCPARIAAGMCCYGAATSRHMAVIHVSSFTAEKPPIGR
jgi:GNAT superfamily N-acetyltransferase